jgi:hypothetical protein
LREAYGNRHFEPAISLSCRLRPDSLLSMRINAVNYAHEKSPEVSPRGLVVLAVFLDQPK